MHRFAAALFATIVVVDSVQLVELIPLRAPSIEQPIADRPAVIERLHEPRVLVRQSPVSRQPAHPPHRAAAHTDGLNFVRPLEPADDLGDAARQR